MNMNQSAAILVVEDEWLVREEIASEFRRSGWTVLESSTGEGAIGVLESGERVAALVTDVQLAGRADGWEVARVFRAMHPEGPIVYTSGNPADARRLMPGSVFVAKPCPPATLVEACESADPPRARRRRVSRL
jgi:CheY-like chemotaxis protein